jgi:hypothetical protein
VRLRSIIHNTLKSICLSRRPQSSALLVKVFSKRAQSLVLSPHRFFSRLFIFLLPCTLYLISAMLPAASAAVATLGWSPNDEPDLEGYVVYRNPEKSGPPYKYSDEVQEDELEDSLNPRLKLTGLKKDTKYYVALTAYNNEGIESSFSNEVCIEVIENAIQACSDEAVSPSTNTSSDKGGSGGGGGGDASCFISTASHNPSNNHIILYLLFTITAIGIVPFPQDL